MYKRQAFIGTLNNGIYMTTDFRSPLKHVCSIGSNNVRDITCIDDEPAEGGNLLGGDAHREVQPHDAYLTGKARAAHGHAPPHGVFHERQAPFLQGRCV